MSQHNDLLDKIWKTLANALDQIFEFRPMTQNTYMELYKSVFVFLNQSCNE
jgi:hypothetical protein